MTTLSATLAFVLAVSGAACAGPNENTAPQDPVSPPVQEPPPEAPPQWATPPAEVGPAQPAVVAVPPAPAPAPGVLVGSSVAR